MGTAAERQTEWARLLIDSLVRAGIRDAVISPGSRSTPFVMAALDHDGLRCTSAIDERSAAFYALGQARSTESPSLLVCTSGSAPANYYPAVIEASEAGVPLLILSADRPPDLLQCGANQTTQQISLYGVHARYFSNLGEPSDEPSRLRALKRTAVQAVAAAVGRRPGPVHLNAQARKPLEPVVIDAAFRELVDAIAAEPISVLGHGARGGSATVEPVSDSLVEAVTAAFDSAARPMIVCGPASVRTGSFAAALGAVSERAAAPVYAEASSQFRWATGASALGALDTIWRTAEGRARVRPDFVLQIGASPVSKGFEDLLAERPVRRFVVHPWEWADPSSTAEAILQIDSGSLLAALSNASFRLDRRDSEFPQRTRRAEALAWSEADRLLDEEGEALSEASATREVIAALPDGSAVALGNSLPIRNVETWAPPGGRGLRVYSQRGASGIDGLVSGAAGAASCSAEPTTLLVGDVSFLHDLGGLGLASRVSGPLVIVVLNNGGGRIFEQLPIAREGDEASLSFFTTPHSADLGSAAATYGCAHRLVRTTAQLREALRAAYDGAAATVVEAVVPPQSALRLSDELRARLAAALAREAP